MFWPAYVITLKLPKPSGNYIFYKIEHKNTVLSSCVFTHCASLPTYKPIISPYGINQLVFVMEM